MRARLKSRLDRLEQKQAAEKPTYGQVVWLGPDGQPETPLAALDPARPTIFLPRKSASAEQWVLDVQRRGWGRRG